LIQGNANVSFEAIQEQLAHTLSDKSVPSLSAALRQYEGQHKQVVLIVDDAGELVPGLIYAIIHFAAANPVLRVIFSLTHDELQLKRGSDKAVDDCHIVEIPTLSEKQCGDFLQHLSTNPALNLSFKAISENMIAHIYRETHGVPGRIIAELSGMPGRKQGGALKWMLALAAAGAIVFAIGVKWQPWLQNSHKNMPVPAAVEQTVEAVQIQPQKPEAQIPLTLPTAQPASLLETTLLDASEQKPKQSEEPSLAQIVEEQAASVLEFKDQAEPMNAVSLETKPEIKTVEVPRQKIIEPPLVQPEKSKPAELKAIVKPEKSVVASANNFTLQLMVLSKQASVSSMLKKYPAMAAGTRTIKTLANGQEKFVLEYGSYPDAVSASKARQSLPAEFHNAMVKKQGAR
jgi:DamX protein